MVAWEANIKEGEFRAFQNLLSEMGDWRLNINGMTFEVMLCADSRKLELPFFDEEFLVALSSLSGDKAVGAKWIYYNILANELGEFFDNCSFEQNLNVMFLVLIPNIGAVENLKNFTLISLVGGFFVQATGKSLG